MKLPQKDNLDAVDTHAATRDRKIAERERPTDNRKSVSLIAKLAIKAVGKRATKRKR